LICAFQNSPFLERKGPKELQTLGIWWNFFCHCEAGRLRFCASKSQLGNVAIFKLQKELVSPSALKKFRAREARRTWEKRETFAVWLLLLPKAAAQILKFFDPLFFKKVGTYGLLKKKNDFTGFSKKPNSY